jgi:glutamyl-tRNA reductase
MAILALGISYRRATVDLLERLAFGTEDLPKAYRRALDEPAIDEAVILSTCNRVEVYASVPAYHSGFLALKRVLLESHGVDPDELAEPLYSHFEDDAAQHLFEVAAGLDSMVIGEPQILAQVRQAYRQAVVEGASGQVLGTLFPAASRAGRRVRAETGVGAAPDAFVRAGVGVAQQALDGLTGRRVLVVGAGQIAALAAGHARASGAGPVRVLSRTPEGARAVAERIEAEHGDLADLESAIVQADLVISATGATRTLIDEATVRSATEGRTRPLFILDLAVPRDVEPKAGSLDGVTLVDIEGLRSIVQSASDARSNDIVRAHRIVEEEVRRFAIRRRSERLAPLIRALRERGEAVLASELRRFASDLDGLTPGQREATEALARGIVAKILHDPIVRLKELSGPGSEATYARVLADLFGIEGIEPLPE